MTAPRAYYNEIDPYAAAWLRNLIAAGLIADGDVDERSIVDVRPDDLNGYTQCHFFAGIGGWSFALRLAGVRDDQPFWTGSCPCQDFSVVGKRKGFEGDRDLWPNWFRLIGQRRPYVVFGEQVDGAPQWLDRTCSDLEGLDYACGTAVIPALAVRAQHERLRLYFVADSDKARRTHAPGLAAPEALAIFRSAAGVVRREPAMPFRRPLEPDESWVVDGLSGEGLAVGAFGNAIVPPVAAEFIGAYLDLMPGRESASPDAGGGDG